LPEINQEVFLPAPLFTGDVQEDETEVPVEEILK